MAKHFIPRLAAAAFAIALTVLPCTAIGQPPDAAARPIVVISDLHFGVGRNSDGSWHPTEDFRWSGALRGFLDYVSSRNGDRLDLVIAGDFLELWQPPADLRCEGSGADLGCTIPQMMEIVRRVVAAHQADLAALAAFARRGANRLYIVPGNHDSALVIPEVWKLVASALDVAGGRVFLADDGVWSSADGQVVIEHGHQIGSDVNGYQDWPRITERRDGREYIVRPWGELFVQRLFNAEEEAYPIIDNLSPETAGARYRMADRGLWRSAADVARFAAFNLFETSVTQKAATLGRPGEAAPSCAPADARARGHRLVTGALDPDDAFRLQVESATPEAAALRGELDTLVRNLPEEELAHLCARQVEAGTLGAAIESRFVPRVEVMKKHIGERRKKFPGVSVFVYGHTHQFEEAWDVRLDAGRVVTVLNTGAFQRVVDEAGYLERVKKLGLAIAHEGLRRIRPEDLAPCYGAVLVSYRAGIARAETMLWRMQETGTGELVSPGAGACM